MTNVETKNLLPQLPAIEKLLNTQEMLELQATYARPLVIETLRAVVADIRSEILSGNQTQLPEHTEYAERTRQKIAAKTAPRMRPIVNATGTVTHTNLGRSLLSDDACEAIQQAAQNYVNLEYDIETGRRGHRDRITEPLLQQLTGCEASTVVNNNAAAVLLALQTVARGKEVIVSRGELIEIGGAFRIPDVMAASGAILREVGTTNRTHLRDYAEAINENTGLLLKVHPSNYKILGFTSTPTMEEITELGAQQRIPTMEDLGSGALIDMAAYGLPHEPLVGERIASGVDIVTFSGDKLLGGPQAGLIVGKSEWIEKMRKNPMMRALRVDKLIIAGLSATLQRYLIDSTTAAEQFPMLNRYTRSIETLHAVAEKLKAQLQDLFAEKLNIQVSETYGQIGSGALPVETLPSIALVLESAQISAEMLAAQFRNATIPVIGRIKDGLFWLDLRTVYEREQTWIVETATQVAKTL
ncbi:L-seryl-tRNA(Sec) selenium transferase [Candidatus Poribacteria bacterium]|nr:L-seryl-tRNA(Sec) selenium transferase [Candidatus Poribacteria bacterium]MYH83768.1 L-seryl-tRNA(Sec) selenium transferase [Candidatus Poribacteria bacterium]MYK95836.1 L-seryl-tRNA(Sec) selenium transferase [Candidatus Poribacteria bacterium]